MKWKRYSKEIRVWVVEETMQTEDDLPAVQNQIMSGDQGCGEKGCHAKDLSLEWGDYSGGLQRKSMRLMEENCRLRQKIATTEQENQMLKKRTRRNHLWNGILTIVSRVLRLVLSVLRIKV